MKGQQAGAFCCFRFPETRAAPSQVSVGGQCGATPALMPGRGVLQQQQLFDAQKGLRWLYFEGSCCHACRQRQ